MHPSKHTEYVFNLAELKALINAAPSGDDDVYVTVGFDCTNSSNREYLAKVEATTGTSANKNLKAAVEGCPKPPGCPINLQTMDLK